MSLETLLILVLVGAVAITLILPLLLAFVGERNVFVAWWLVMRAYFGVVLLLFVVGMLFGNSMHRATDHMHNSLPDCWEWVDQVNAWVDSIK